MIDLINREFYEAIISFDEDEGARELYYRIMDSPSGRLKEDGRDETVRERILRAYAVLFCEEKGAVPGLSADAQDVYDTADRLYIGSVGFDPKHWYRMRHHFPVIDDDNYDRFAALVISDLKAGPLHDKAAREGMMLIVGEADPLHMTKEERESQRILKIDPQSIS